MNVYVVNIFERNDRTCEHGNDTVAVYTSEEEAIKHAKSLAKDFRMYKNQKESKCAGMPYCCRYDSNGSDYEYADFVLVSVFEHELLNEFKKKKSYKLKGIITREIEMEVEATNLQEAMDLCYEEYTFDRIDNTSSIIIDDEILEEEGSELYLCDIQMQDRVKY